MNNFKLILPSLEIKTELSEFLRDLNDGENGYGGSDFAKGILSIEEQIQVYQNQHLGNNLNEGKVPQTTFLLVNSNSEIIGMSRLRHKLNEKILIKGGHIGYFIRKKFRNQSFGTLIFNLTLQEASKLKIPKVLITVNSDNLKSISVIEKNNGILEDERIDENGIKYKRYWIDLIGN